jgi:hypothetical protein
MIVQAISESERRLHDMNNVQFVTRQICISHVHTNDRPV